MSWTNCNVTNRNVTNHRIVIPLQTDKTFCNELHIKQQRKISAIKRSSNFDSDRHSLGNRIFQKLVIFFHVLFS